ncbi:MAG: DNA-binding response regulator [Rickettsiales bacterium TMED254]|nr:DNA-binding response regulator [Rickettsiales bacterium]RPF76866.1 MAG: DNA-binding response regulator [Rickettsiales bacterium TMED254]|tara:strand:+ start:30 stop:728 length:699 start_codon:yes stop_codon:yes gene_type:complete
MKSKFIKNPHILCIDDDDKIRKLISKFLIKNNFLVSSSPNAIEAEKLINFYTFDLIILDIMMPKVDGISFLESFRKKNIRTPVLMLSALSGIEKKIKTYKIGCDDYLVKPFEPIELILRINKLLSPRITAKINQKVIFGDYEFDLNLNELRKEKELIKLTDKECLILKFLSKNLNTPISREKIASNLNMNNNTRTVDVFIARLRKKIENQDGSSFLKTVRGKGYTLKSDYDV